MDLCLAVYWYDERWRYGWDIKSVYSFVKMYARTYIYVLYIRSAVNTSTCMSVYMICERWTFYGRCDDHWWWILSWKGSMLNTKKKVHRKHSKHNLTCIRMHIVKSLVWFSCMLSDSKKSRRTRREQGTKNEKKNGRPEAPKCFSKTADWKIQ